MKKISAITLLFVMSASICFAAPTFTNVSTANVGANMATLKLAISEGATGYFTLLTGSIAPCGTSTQVKAGQTATDTVAPYFGSLPLVADTPGHYTVRNLSANSSYTLCLTATPQSEPEIATINLTTTAATALTYPGWNPAGGAGFSGTPAHFTSLAFAPDGTPYVASVNANDGYKISVMSYNGSSWNLAGSAGFAVGSANPVSMAFAPDGSLHISFVDADYTVQVMLYNSVSNSWSLLGAPDSLADTDITSLAFAPDGTPLVAYIDGIDSSAQIMTYSGGVWTSAAVTTVAAATPSLAIAPDGTPYLAYADYGNGGRATVMKFDGANWISVGTPGFSVGTATNASLAIAPDGSLYLAYQDGAASGRATVLKFAGTNWTTVGSAGFSTGTATDISLAIAPDGKPSVAFQDGANSARATVLKYNGSDWNPSGSAGFSAASASSTVLAFAPNGLPYVAYGDNGNGSRATLMQFTDITPTISGDPPTTATIDVPYSFQATSPYATSFSATNNLPPGLTFDTNTGVLSGTPTTLGTYPGIIITATNTVGSTSLPAFSITVTEATATGSVRIGSTPYQSISVALQAAGSGSKLEILATIAPEWVNYSGSGVITLEGGYNEGWTTRGPNLFSPVSSLTITGGTLIIDQIAVSGP